MYEYSGAVHIHSVYSDGTGKIEDIARAAFDSGLDFIMMTDHNTLKPVNDGYNRWINGVMVIIGYEVNDMQNKNHYLAFGLNEVIGSYRELGNGELGCKLEAADYVREINEKGGIGFLAHPDEERQHLPEHPSYPWISDSDEYTGIEIWNHMSEWIEGMDDGNKVDRFLHPLRSIIGPNQKSMKRWDQAAEKRHVTAIGGVDAHALKQNVLGFFEVEIFAYKVLFKSIRTHVLIDKPISSNNKDEYHSGVDKILDALKNGKCFISNHYYGSANGFRFFAEFKGITCNMGDVINTGGRPVVLKVLIPKECRIKLIRNGILIDERVGMNAYWNTEKPGIYRVECWLGDKGWIFSNHIRLNN
ncbi:MAG: PHP domain-containing protein [Ignavibacteria bacterium]|nr:PHP domain-containing protein [Ignavibacteria bacterium]MCC7159378.1 PHP domain-containing protein [Ignavibacteria bacterium]